MEAEAEGGGRGGAGVRCAPGPESYGWEGAGARSGEANKWDGEKNIYAPGTIFSSGNNRCTAAAQPLKGMYST